MLFILSARQDDISNKYGPTFCGILLINQHISKKGVYIYIYTIYSIDIFNSYKCNCSTEKTNLVTWYHSLQLYAGQNVVEKLLRVGLRIDGRHNVTGAGVPCYAGLVYGWMSVKIGKEHDIRVQHTKAASQSSHLTTPIAAAAPCHKDWKKPVSCTCKNRRVGRCFALF